MADDAGDFFNPTGGSSLVQPGDPLQDWAAQNIDWRTGRLLQQDPVQAIQSLIDRGIPPPDVHAGADGKALPYADQPIEPFKPDATGPLEPSVFEPVGDPSQGNLTRPADQAPKPMLPPNLPPPVGTTTPNLPPVASPLEPAEEPVPLPRSRPLEAGPGASDLSASKKPKAADALSDFSKSLSGIKAPTAPPLNAVGTPGVRSPAAVNAPNLANLLALTQGAAPQSLAANLGRLLVAGKA